MSEEFGDALRAARERLRLAQADVCAAVNDRLTRAGLKDTLRQATLSAWERGKQRPAPEREDQLRVLAEVLKLDFEALHSLLDDNNHFSRGRHRLHTPQEAHYIEEAQGFIEAQAYAVDLWFIGPTRLPVVASERIRGSWIDNIHKGVNYNLLWFLDLLDRASFSMTTQRLAEIADAISRFDVEPKGRIIHWIASGDFSSLGHSELGRLLNELSSLTPSHSIVHSVTDIAEPLRREFLIDGMGIATIALYKPRTYQVSPLASLAIRKARMRLAEPEGTVFLWLGEEESHRLRAVVDSLRLAKEIPPPSTTDSIETPKE
jgi:transcriptional regulator with XRE-family HTH domain